MSRRICRILVLGALVLPLVGLAADPSPEVLTAGIVLLRNGEMIQGRITQTGDRYDVALNDGEIHIRVIDVEAICQSLDECYAVKRSHILNGNASDHLALAEWCIRHGRLTDARVALKEVADLDASHPKLALVERRLKLAAEKPALEAAPAEPAIDRPSNDELDRAAHALPPHAVENFTTHIQPLLLNHCSNAGCHGPQSTTSFRLLRLPTGRTGSRRSTQRNLYATLAQVNRDRPDNSPLLTAPASPHGTAKAAIFPKHQANRYRQLFEWVYLVSNQKAEELPAEPFPSATDVAPGKLPAGMEKAKPLTAEADHPAPAKIAETPTKPAKTLEAKSWPTTVTPAEFLSRKPVQRGAPVEEFVPKDEFDPEIFNRGQK